MSILGSPCQEHRLPSDALRKRAEYGSQLPSRRNDAGMWPLLQCTRTSLDTFRRWCYYPARYFGVGERDIRQLINTFVAPVSRQVPIAPDGGPRVGGTSAPGSGGPT